jgi:hypothetical protein
MAWTFSTDRGKRRLNRLSALDEQADRRIAGELVERDHVARAGR